MIVHGQARRGGAAAPPSPLTLSSGARETEQACYSDAAVYASNCICAIYQGTNLFQQMHNLDASVAQAHGTRSRQEVLQLLLRRERLFDQVDALRARLIDDDRLGFCNVACTQETRRRARQSAQTRSQIDQCCRNSPPSLSFSMKGINAPCADREKPARSSFPSSNHNRARSSTFCDCSLSTSIVASFSDSRAYCATVSADHPATSAGVVAAANWKCRRESRLHMATWEIPHSVAIEAHET